MIAYVFPGQGSQFPSMGKDLYESSKEAKKLFEKANEILGFDFIQILFEGSSEELRETQIAQPAIYTHSVIACRLLKNFSPKALAGHSLGEFSALAAAKVFSFEEGLRLVQQRALAMSEACKENLDSGMYAVLGLDEEIVVKICEQVKGICQAANYNCPGQIVISGELAALEEAAILLKKEGAKRIIPLNVSGAFHSSLMKTAKEKFSLALEKIDFKKPICSIYQNVNALPVEDPILLKKNCLDQLTKPVKWRQTIENMINKGIREFVEVGPGNVLQGLIKKINKEVKVYQGETL